MKIPIIVLTAACTLGLTLHMRLAAQDVDPIEPDPLPEHSTTESLYPEETETEILIPENTEAPFETDPLMDLEIPAYEEIPSYEEIPLPKEREFVVPESKLGKELENKTRLFEARVKASVDPQLQAELRRAQRVKTYPERRQAMFNYYMGLYGKMLKMEPELEKLIISERQAELRTLQQTQIQPSVWPVPPPDFPVVDTKPEDNKPSR